MEQRHHQQMILESDSTALQQRFEDMRQLEVRIVPASCLALAPPLSANRPMLLH